MLLSNMTLLRNQILSKAFLHWKEFLEPKLHLSPQNPKLEETNKLHKWINQFYQVKTEKKPAYWVITMDENAILIKCFSNKDEIANQLHYLYDYLKNKK